MHETAQTESVTEAPSPATDHATRNTQHAFRHWGLLGVLILALALRLIPLALVLANGGNPLIGDESNYVVAAQSLAQGGGIPDLWLWIRPPAYIVFNAAIFLVSNGSLVALQLAQIAISLLTIVATYTIVLAGLTHRPAASDPQITIRNPQSAIHNPQSVALLAAAILAVQPSLILATGLFLTETLFLFLLTLLIGALVGYYRAAGRRVALGWAAAAGALAGLALLTRASMTPLVVLALGALLVRRPWPGRQRLATGAVFVACLGLMLVPWTVRNAIHYGRFLPVDTGGYQVIWTDNTDLSNHDVRDALFRIANPADRGNYALTQAVQWIAGHPGEFLDRARQRMIDSLAPDNFTELGYPVRDKFPGRAAWERDAFSFAAWWGWTLLFGLALAGWLRAPRTPLWGLAGGVVAVYVLTGSLTHDEFRYRYQLFSLLAIYAAWAVLRAGRAVRPVRGRPAGWTWAVPVGVFLLWMLLTWPTFGPGFMRAVQANLAIRQAATAQTAGNLPEAASGYAQAAALEPTNAAVRRDLGAVQVQQGQPDAATATWAEALAREPGDWRTRALLADLWRRMGQTKQARDVARAVPPVFNGVMLDWAWTGLNVRAPLTLTAGLDDVGFVRGFQIGEDGPDGLSFRWAGPDRQSSIRLAGGLPAGARLTLVLTGLPQTPPLPPARPVTVAANGQPLGTFQVGPGWTPYTFDLPPAIAAAPEVVVTFDSPPQQASAQDLRYLSFALQTATLAPAR